MAEGEKKVWPGDIKQLFSCILKAFESLDTSLDNTIKSKVIDVPINKKAKRTTKVPPHKLLTISRSKAK